MRNKLTKAQRQAVLALQHRATMQDAAQAAGVNERTVRRWMKSSAVFQNTVRQAQLMAWQTEARANQLAA